jgi:hypothetical protein
MLNTKLFNIKFEEDLLSRQPLFQLTCFLHNKNLI